MSGYWVPFEAAKAVAARLCYHIRYLLVPVFGPDFIAMCYQPDDLDFQNLSVDQEIIQRCQKGAAALQVQSRASSAASSPQTPTAYASLPLWPPAKSLRPKPSKATDVESGYGTDTDRSETYASSLGSSTNNNFTPVNTPKTSVFGGYQNTSTANVTSTPRAKISSVKSPKTKTSKRKRTKETPCDFEAASHQSSPESQGPLKRRKILPTGISNGMMPEIGAAYTLIQLNKADAILERKLVRTRRASA